MDFRTLTYNLGGIFCNGKGQAPCPVCQTERRKDQNALSLTERNGKILAHCFKSNCSFYDILTAANLPFERMEPDPIAQRETSQRQAEYNARNKAKAASMWDVSKPITGTKAEAYLRGRAITGELPQSLRFMPDILHKPSMKWCCALIAKVSSGGIHRTFFDKQGNRLSKDAKMMLGPCSGGAVTLSEGTGPLVVCEGIETGLSLVQLLTAKSPCVWAALSTGGIKTLNLPSEPGKLIIATDGDSAGKEAGNALAIRAAALGWQVSTLPAPNGCDWNDVLNRGKFA